MRFAVVLVLFASVGCSTAPLADFLDLVRPAKFAPDRERDAVEPFGPTGPPQPGGTLLPPDTPVPIPAPAPTPGSFQPPPNVPPANPSSPAPLRVPNT